MATHLDIVENQLGPLSLVAGLFLCAGFVVLLALVGFALWLVFGAGPRRSRAHARAQHLLHEGEWREALALVHELQQQGGLAHVWQERLRNAEGECYHKAGDLALQEKRYEDSLQQYDKAAHLLSLNAAELRGRVIEAMLGEVRRLVAGAFGSGRSADDLAAAQALVARTLACQSPCAEASFWQGMCHAKEGQVDQALAALTTAHEGTPGRFLDPPLYLGALLLRQRRVQESLRYLAEANRADSSCPLVPWQLGMAMVAAGGDGRIAVQALQRACGPRGFSLWLGAQDAKRRPDQQGGVMARFWVDALPENRSYVRRLALKHSYSCPVFGDDLGAMLRQGQFALAQAYYRLGNFQESADVFTKLLQESPPSAPLLRGLGLALARLERYDQAYKHLRIALEQEEPKDPLTAGYLALCGALGKPTQADDKPRNVAWAIRLLVRFLVVGDPEWARLASAIFAEARQLNMAVAVEDQVRLCNVLASVNATNPEAAGAYDHLAATHPDAVTSEHAWLYCRAAHEHGYKGQCDLDLFARTFREADQARAFYAQRSWDLDELEYAYLVRCAEQRPGSFPPELGSNYPAVGESRLLARARQQEEAGQPDAALATAEVLVKLAPGNPVALDYLAHLRYRRHDLAGAAALLENWQQLEPGNPVPLCRRAVIEQQRGEPDARRQALGRALGAVGRGPGRAAVAFLGARLALQEAGRSRPRAEGEGATGPSPLVPEALKEARLLLVECLKSSPDHADALWLLAALRSYAGDHDGLVALAKAMHRPQVADCRFQYMAAVCHLAAGDYPRVIDAAGRAARDPNLAADSHYLMAWAHLHQNDPAAAVTELQKVTATPAAASVEHARALLGRLRFGQGDLEEAIACWDTLAPGPRRDWQFEEPLRSTLFLSGLLAYREGRFEQASIKFREAGRLGLRERRLGSLLTLALFRAGQRLLFGEPSPLPPDESVPPLRAV